jgi:hypothetical protein
VERQPLRCLKRLEQIAALSLGKRFERSKALERLEQLEPTGAPVSDVLADYFLANGGRKAGALGHGGEGKKLLDERVKPDGYNVGINIDVDAGQTIMHCYIHLIPWRSGDSANPRGGVRGVIPGKADYSRLYNSSSKIQDLALPCSPLIAGFLFYHPY